MNAWAHSQVVIPAASSAPNVSGAAERDADALVGEDHEQDDDEVAPTQPELLADDREDEVVAGVRQEQPAGARLWPSPSPMRPPEPSASSPWTEWKPMPAGSAHGSSKARIRSSW